MLFNKTFITIIDRFTHNSMRYIYYFGFKKEINCIKSFKKK
jgi:hypothetical protein